MVCAQSKMNNSSGRTTPGGGQKEKICMRL